MKKIVLDTNAYSALIEGDKEVEAVLNQANQIYLPFIVIGELYYGFKKGSKEVRNREILSAFEAMPTVEHLYPNSETLEIYSDIFLELKNNGTPIPTNDVWIAACTIETGSVLITFDKHFLNVSKIRAWKKLET